MPINRSSFMSEVIATPGGGPAPDPAQPWRAPSGVAALTAAIAGGLGPAQPMPEPRPPGATMRAFRIPEPFEHRYDGFLEPGRRAPG
jgi:hypothetical protein